MGGGPRVVAGALTVLLVGCATTPDGSAVVPDTVVDGVLTACVAPTPRLVEEEVDGGWVGYDVEALEEVAAALGLELAFVEVPFDDLVSGIALNDASTCDIGAGGVIEADELETLVDVTVAYRAVDRLVVAPASAASSPLESLRVGVEDGGPAADALGRFEAAETVASPSRADLLRLLAQGDVDAVLVPAQEVPEVEQVVGPVAIVERVGTGDRTVMVLPRGTDEQVAAAVDDALRGFTRGPRGRAAAERWLAR